MSRAAKRTTVSGQDVVRALDDIDMPEYSAAAQDYLVAFKKASGKAAAAAKARRGSAAAKAAAAGEAEPSGESGAADAPS